MSVLADRVGRKTAARSEDAAGAFTESANARLNRLALGAAYALRPRRIKALPHIWKDLALWALPGERARPGPERVKDAAGGLCGISNDLTPAHLLAQLRRGVYPFCHIGPMKWWCPAERMVVAPDAFHIGKNLRRTIRRTELAVTFDTAFAEVVAACAEPRSGRRHLTWVTPRVMRAMTALHEAGHAHSFEVWSPEGTLVGGGYGVAIGRVFATESQFSRIRDASKIGFAALNHHLAATGFVLNDGKQFAPNLAEQGFALLPRAEFLALLAEHGQGEAPTGRWHAGFDLAEVAGAGRG